MSSQRSKPTTDRRDKAHAAGRPRKTDAASDRRRNAEPHPRLPSEVSDHVSLFDRFATAATQFVSRAWFFALCVLLVLVWAPSYVMIGDVNTWQLIINTITTIVTFLLVALLQNGQTRSDEATQHKLNAIAGGLADVMGAMSKDVPNLKRDRTELRRAVGLEEQESA